MHRLSPVYQELGEPSGDDSLADAALALEHQVNGGSDCAAVLYISKALRQITTDCDNSGKPHLWAEATNTGSGT